MGEEAVKEMVAVLPYGFGDDEGGVGIKGAEDLHAHFLRIDEAVLFLFVVRVGAKDGPTMCFQSLGEPGFHFGLLRPTLLVGGKPQVAVGHQVDLLRFQAGNG